MNSAEQKKRLQEIGELMKKAKGKELDKLTAEVDRIIGFDSGDSKYDPVKDGAVVRGWGRNGA